MKTTTRKIIVFACFILAVIYGLYNLPGGDKTKKAAVPASGDKESSAVQGTTRMNDIDTDFYSSLEWGRDPFYRAARKNNKYAKTPECPEWILNGILHDNNSPAAVINKQIIRIGDTIDGARVMQIEKQKVTLERNGLQFDLYISKDKS